MFPRRSLALACIPALLLASACSPKEEGKSFDPGDPARIVSFGSTPGTIGEGESATLTWITEHVSAVRIVDGDGEAIDLMGASAASGSVEVRPLAGHGATFTLIATSERDGATLQRALTVGVVVQGGPRIDSFASSPSSIHAGGKATLSWSTTNAVRVMITAGDRIVVDSTERLVGEEEDAPTETTRYLLTAVGARGEVVTEEASVTLTEKPIISSFTATPTRFDVQIGHADVSLVWQVSGATGLGIESTAGAPVDITGWSSDGQVAVHVTETTTFRLIASNAAGFVEAEVTVTEVGPPTAHLTASSTQVGEGDEITLAWETTDAETVELFAGGVLENSLPASGQVTRSIDATTDFMLRATNAFGDKFEVELTIEVGTVGISDVTVSKERVAAGQDVEIGWTAFGGTRVLVRGPDGLAVPDCDFTDREDIVHGTCTVRPDEEGEFTYTVELSAGAAPLSSKNAIVVARAGAGILEFTATPTEIADGGVVTISWQTEGDIDGGLPVLTLENDDGSTIDIADEDPLGGFIGQTMTGLGTHILTLTATAPRGAPATATITIEVTSP